MVRGDQECVVSQKPKGQLLARCKLRETEDFSRKGEIFEDTHIYILFLITYLFILEFS